MFVSFGSCGDLLYLVKGNIFPAKIETEIERENNFKIVRFYEKSSFVARLVEEM